MNVEKATAEVPIYLSAEEWQGTYDQLMTGEPHSPSLLNMYSAYGIYRTYEAPSRKFKKSRDKKQHCYMGCLVAAQVNYGTALYLAWYKEYQDLTDCNPKSFFDLKDQTATIKGADYGVSDAHPTPELCFQWCDQNKLR